MAALCAGGAMVSTKMNRAKALLLAAGFLTALASPALAQSVPADEDAETTTAEQAPAQSADEEDVLKGIDVSKLDWSQLNVDASTLGDGPAAKMRSSQTSDGGMSWSNRNGTNGSSAVSVKQSVTPYWDARIGADMTVTREPTTMSELLAEKAANGGSLPQSGGSAWAAVTAPGAGSVWDKTSVEARVDPNQDEGKVGTSISKQVLLSEQYSLTFSNGANVIQQGVVPGLGASQRTERTYQAEQSAKLDVTGTSFSAGQTVSTSEDKWLRRLGAEQKLFGGMSISGSVGETAHGTTNKSISAGFKKSW